MIFKYVVQVKLANAPSVAQIQFEYVGDYLFGKDP